MFSLIWIFFFFWVLCASAFQVWCNGNELFFGCAVHLMKMWKSFLYAGQKFSLPSYRLFGCIVRPTNSVCNAIAFANMVAFLVKTIFFVSLREWKDLCICAIGIVVPFCDDSYLWIRYVCFATAWVEHCEELLRMLIDHWVLASCGLETISPDALPYSVSQKSWVVELQCSRTIVHSRPLAPSLQLLKGSVSLSFSRT